MSRETVELVRRSVDAFSRGDLDGVRDGLAPEFEFDPSGRFMVTQRVYDGARPGPGPSSKKNQMPNATSNTPTLAAKIHSSAPRSCL